MSVYTAETLDFSRLDPPSLATVDFASRLAELVAKFGEYWAYLRATTRPDLPVFDTGKLDQDPVALLLQIYAYGDINLRQAVNDAANSLRLAFATSSDLDNLAQTYLDTPRKTLIPANLQTGAPAGIIARARNLRRKL